MLPTFVASDERGVQRNTDRALDVRDALVDHMYSVLFQWTAHEHGLVGSRLPTIPVPAIHAAHAVHAIHAAHAGHATRATSAAHAAPRLHPRAGLQRIWRRCWRKR